MTRGLRHCVPRHPGYAEVTPTGVPCRIAYWVWLIHRYLGITSDSSDSSDLWAAPRKGVVDHTSHSRLPRKRSAIKISGRLEIFTTATKFSSTLEKKPPSIWMISCVSGNNASKRSKKLETAANIPHPARGLSLCVSFDPDQSPCRPFFHEATQPHPQVKTLTLHWIIPYIYQTKQHSIDDALGSDTRKRR